MNSLRVTGILYQTLNSRPSKAGHGLGDRPFGLVGHNRGRLCIDGWHSLVELGENYKTAGGRMAFGTDFS